MSQTSPSIEKGDSHSVLVSGDIVDVFVARWEDHPIGRALIRYDVDNSPPDGELMCVIRLRHPMSIEEYRESSHHPQTRPLMKSPQDKVEAVLLPASMACTIPDFMEIE